MNENNYRHRKRNNRLRSFLTLFICILLFLILLLILILFFLNPKEEDFIFFQPSTETEMQTQPQTQAVLETETQTEQMQTEAPEEVFDPYALQETDIYTFMQGPKAWESKVDYSGSWCEVVLKDQEFSVFGCGLCDLANIYSTLTPYDCSPLDMYYYAQEVSKYSPVSGFGAIDWPYMRDTLKSVGITSRLRRKDKTYEEFREMIAGSISAIVLVCSDYDDTYWQGVEGHYVNIWLYDEEDDTVFLADSGNPSHNRQRVPLRYLYDAMKASSLFHYMLITSVNWDKNTWQHDGIDIEWKQPKYYKKGKVKQI